MYVPMYVGMCMYVRTFVRVISIQYSHTLQIHITYAPVATASSTNCTFRFLFSQCLTL